MPPSDGPLRIACFGLVHRDAGSVASANHRLVQQLVIRGHHVEFFAGEGFLPDPEIKGGNGTFVFRPMHLTEPRWATMTASAMRGRFDLLRGLRFTRDARKRVGHLISDDPAEPFDVLLVLGLPAPANVSAPVVAWPQGLPGGELAVVRSRARLIASISGWRAYLPLRLFYEVKDLLRPRPRGDWLVVASQASRQEAISLGCDPGRVFAVPYAVDLERFQPEERDTKDTRRLLCLGRLDPRKRIDLLVQATALLATRRSDFVVDVVGRPGYLGGWSELVEEASASFPIRLRQPVPQTEAATLLAQADLLVQPSEAEEFGHAVAESLAAGTPVVVGATNRTQEYIDEAVGSRFEEYTPAALADAIERWLDAPRGSASDACRAAAERSFSPDVVAAAVEDVLYRACANGT